MNDSKHMLVQLQHHFRPEDIEWRVQRAGEGKSGIWARVVPYLTSRAIQDRLDAVVGPQNWRTSFHQVAIAKGGFICVLEIRCGTEWVAKSDGADLTEIEPLKGGISNALKRAAVHWGIGRYLYDVEDCWAETSTEKRPSNQGWRHAAFGPKESRRTFWWRPPRLPAALPPQDQTQRSDERAEPSAPAPASEHDPQREQLKKDLKLAMQRHGVSVDEVERYCAVAFPGRGPAELLSHAELQVTINWIRHGARRGGGSSSAGQAA